MKYLAAVAAAIAVMAGLRWWLLSTRGARYQRQRVRAQVDTSVRQSATARLISLARWPVFFILVAVTVALGLLAGMLAGPH
jgi:sterol desaturase/sphingolipid hydroxylase (fatty acid hydroxylase superfamily)